MTSAGKSDSYATDMEQMVEWFNRECRCEDCNKKMEDMSRRVAQYT